MIQRLFLLLLASQTAHHGAETETVEQSVEAQGAQQAIDDTAQTQSTEQAAHDAEHTAEQQTHGGDNLEQRLAQQTPERVELLLGVGHILKLPLGAVNAFGDRTGEL